MSSSPLHNNESVDDTDYSDLPPLHNNNESVDATTSSSSSQTARDSVLDEVYTPEMIAMLSELKKEAQMLTAWNTTKNEQLETYTKKLTSSSSFHTRQCIEDDIIKMCSNMEVFEAVYMGKYATENQAHNALHSRYIAPMWQCMDLVNQQKIVDVRSRTNTLTERVLRNEAEHHKHRLFTDRQFATLRKMIDDHRVVHKIIIDDMTLKCEAHAVFETRIARLYDLLNDYDAVNRKTATDNSERFDVQDARIASTIESHKRQSQRIRAMEEHLCDIDTDVHALSNTTNRLFVLVSLVTIVEIVILLYVMLF